MYRLGLAGQDQEVFQFHILVSVWEEERSSAPPTNRPKNESEIYFGGRARGRGALRPTKYFTSRKQEIIGRRVGAGGGAALPLLRPISCLRGEIKFGKGEGAKLRFPLPELYISRKTNLVL